MNQLNHCNTDDEVTAFFIEGYKKIRKRMVNRQDGAFDEAVKDIEELKHRCGDRLKQIHEKEKKQ